MFKRYQHIHFVGIGGIGMSGIADVLLTLGYDVSGSDLKSSPVTRRLKKRGASIHYKHKASHVGGAHVVVVSSAVTKDNPEVLEAKQRRIPVVPRAEMLAELMRLKYSIAVAGTHGKTSTTSMIAQVFHGAGLDPTYVIGGKVNSFRTNARLGKGQFLIAEADESDRSFLKLTPTVGVVTNIDAEHMETYNDFSDVCASYDAFVDKVPFYGAVVCCVDHPEVRALRNRCTRPIISYGLSSQADWTATDIVQEQECMRFQANYQGKAMGEVLIHMPGRHNVANALAAIAVAHFLEVPFEKIGKALAQFKGIERRFQVLTKKGPMVINDYAHHPTEIKATVQAAREGWPGRRIVVVHQPHRYSRLEQLFPDFVTTLAMPDRTVVLPVYAAGEKSRKGISGKALVEALRGHRKDMVVDYVSDNSKACAWLQENIEKDDVVLFLGAGDIVKIGQQFGKLVK